MSRIASVSYTHLDVYKRQELLRSALLGLEVTIAAAHSRSARAMKPGLSFLFALFLLAAAAVPEAAASGGVALC